MSAPTRRVTAWLMIQRVEGVSVQVLADDDVLTADEVFAAARETWAGEGEIVGMVEFEEETGWSRTP